MGSGKDWWEACPMGACIYLHGVFWVGIQEACSGGSQTPGLVSSVDIDKEMRVYATAAASHTSLVYPADEVWTSGSLI